MKNLPKVLIRLDDGIRFLLNEHDRYAVESLGNPMWDYTYETLMESPGCKGCFKIADGTEDVEAMQRAWFERIKNAKYDRGHGDDDE